MDRAGILTACFFLSGNARYNLGLPEEIALSLLALGAIRPENAFP